MVLAVALRSGAADAHDAVEVAVVLVGVRSRLEKEQAEEQVTLVLERNVAQRCDVFRRYLVGEHRQRAFWKHDQATGCPLRQLGVDRKRLVPIRRIEFEFLLDVALHQADGDWVSRGS